MKNDSPKHCQLKRKQTLTEWRLLFTKSSFLIFIQLIWLIIKQLSPSGSVHSARYIPRRFPSRYFFPPLFTSPSGNSCIIFRMLRSPILIFRAWVTCGYYFSSTNNMRLTVVCVLGNQCVMGSYMKGFVRTNKTTHQTSSLHFCVVSGKFCMNQWELKLL